ncbi:MAG: type II toxin-antitoxin system VapC family toxin [Acidimicrobiaceae bacterium]|nr:type II toxin-antitoxin system VapC family toxin [Ilumatobacter sp.]MCB9379086.1 type II toxin-antitoxin system VapC family toxin [Acidimicrobiaceae bacterium]MCO5331847.1 type II toxin-antitoxin system VapC family toxin [Ilumatobacteraceae bacterium]
MITYIDTSVLLKLIIEEDGSDRAALVWSSADAVASVSLIEVEARAAIAAAGRGRRLTAAQGREAVRELGALLRVLHVMPVTGELVSAAAELADGEGLRGYDAVHLAAALEIGATVLSSADATLCAAAARCGLHVANPLIV